jgi:hypothetical protein
VSHEHERPTTNGTTKPSFFASTICLWLVATPVLDLYTIKDTADIPAAINIARQAYESVAE